MFDGFPLRDPVGPRPGSRASTALSPWALDLIATEVAAHAADTDRTGVPRATIDALAGAGLLGDALTPPAAMRELSELLAGSDATTWFCWVQHQSPLRTLRGDVPGLREPAAPGLVTDLLPRLRSGDALAAVAFAHVRRPGAANPAATRVAGGWRLDGRLDWVTSWDIADVVMVMAQGAPPDDDVLVCAYLPAGRGTAPAVGLMPGEPLELLAMSGTHTRPITLDGVFVPDAAVGAVIDRAQWLAHDEQRTADANPAAFGVTRGAIAQLDALARQRGDAQAVDLAEALAAECRALRDEAYEQADAGGDRSARLRLRAASLDLAIRSATAVVTAMSGAAMLRGQPAERRVREAMFLLVQAQTPATRAASLSLLRDGAPETSDLA
jgi:alkylation response protein AidB-like acyl-CoA dehydrogenase